MKQKVFTSNIVKAAMKEAKLARQCSDFDFFKIGAVVFSNKKILAFGYNTQKTNPLQRKYNKYRNFDYRKVNACCHAEMHALLKLKKQYPNAKPKDLAIFVYRERKDGSFAMARPCPACEKALRDYGIKDVYYTGSNSLVFEHYEDD